MPMAHYKALTGKDCIEESEPAAFYSYMVGVHTDHIFKMKSAIWDLRQESYYIRQGTIKGICDNICDALDKT